ARIAGKFRTQLDLPSILEIAVRETARALGAQRALVRLGHVRAEMPVAAEWHEAGLGDIGARAADLPVANLALRERRTVTIGDVDADARLRDPLLGDLEVLKDAGSRAVIATPVIVFDELTGVFALYRTEPGDWSSSDVAV